MTRSTRPDTVILAIGSTGDVLPYIALALGLEAEGFPVKFVTHDRFKTLAEARGLRTEVTEFDPYSTLLSEDGRAWLESGNDPIAFGLHLHRILTPLLRQFSLGVLAECQEAGAIIASGLACFVAGHVAEKLGIPFLPAYLQPMASTSSFRNPFIVTPLAENALWNRMSHLAYRCGIWGLFRSSINRMRQEALGLPPMRPLQQFPELDVRTPTLYAFSPSVLPKPDDWPGCAHVTGCWFLSEEVGSQAPPGLDEFLESGPPPVCFGFGSMLDRNSGQMTAMALEALARVKRRGILLTGWGGLSTAALPDYVLGLNWAPHQTLFPKMCALVHHGGAGTTAAGLRAGVPTVTIPFFGDQFFWGDRVYRSGAGPRPIGRKHLNVDTLTAAITEAISNPAIANNARSLSERIEAEHGVQNAVQVIRQRLRLR